MSELEIFTCEQGTPEWFACRAMIPTASRFDTVMANGRGGNPSVTRRKYMLELIGERLTGTVAPGYTNEHMERGKVMEAEARDLYAMVQSVDPKQIGFIRRGGIGASPDSLIDDNGLTEIKTKLPHLHLEVLLANEMPSEHKPQVQGELLVSEREWCDFVSYWPGLPIFIKRIYRDEDYIKKLGQGVQDFIDEMSLLMYEIKNLRN